MSLKSFSPIVQGFFVVVLMFVSFAAGVHGRQLSERNKLSATAGLAFHVNQNEKPPAFTLYDPDFQLFWEVWSTLEKRYPFEQPSLQEKIYSSIKGVTFSYGDPYTIFFPPKEAEQFDEDIRGEFVGVGIEIDVVEGQLTVVSPLKDTPAYKAGIKPGDVIVSIDGTATEDITIDEAVGMIRGLKDTQVTLTVARKQEGEIQIPITRAVIVVPTLHAEKLNKDTYLVALYSFTKPASQQFRKALQDASLAGSKNIIVDLRGNPGGILEGAIEIAGMFLPKGKVVVTERKGENTGEIVHRTKEEPIVDSAVKVVILVDGGSASASEILAGALKEHGRATLVGEATFGKGSVQELIHLSRNSSLKVTVAHWFTPNGVSISDAGLAPDKEVLITKEDITAGRDPQMQAALDLLK